MESCPVSPMEPCPVPHMKKKNKRRRKEMRKNLGYTSPSPVWEVLLFVIIFILFTIVIP